MSPENKHCQGAGLVSQKENLLGRNPPVGLGIKFITDAEGQAHSGLWLEVKDWRTIMCLGYGFLLVTSGGVTTALSDHFPELP